MARNDHDSEWERNLSSPPVPGKPDLEQLRESVQQRLGQQVRPRRRRAAWLGSAAAALTLVVAAGGLAVAVHHRAMRVPKRSTQTATTHRTSSIGTPPATVLTSEGELAIFDQTQTFSPSGYPLYTVLMHSHGQTRVSEQQVASHATWARFSPDGQWIAVEIPNAPSSDGSQTNALWLMKSDGTDKVEVADRNFGFGAWIPGKDQFVYGSNLGKVLHVVQPGKKAQVFPVHLSNSALLTAIRFSPDAKYAAILTTIQKQPGGAHDQLLIRNLRTGAQQTLVTTHSPDGMLLGPWSADSSAVFWWPDPMHSASIAADGLMLTETTLSGHSQQVATTLMDFGLQYPQLMYRTVVPTVGRDVLLQLGKGREVFQNKYIGVFQQGALGRLPAQPGRVQLSPDASSDGERIAFTDAPALQNYWGTDARFNAWVQQFTLAVYDAQRHHITDIAGAGKGVQTPIFTAGGEDILYLQGHNVMEIDATGKRAPVHVASLPDGLLQLEDYHS